MSGPAFITQGFVGGVESRVRGSFGTETEVEANKRLEELIKEIAEERRSRLLVRAGRHGVFPFKINDTSPDYAEPFEGKRHLLQGSVIELRSVYENVVSHNAEDDLEPQSYVGSHMTFLPIEWIGRILNDEGELTLKPRDPDPRYLF